MQDCKNEGTSQTMRAYLQMPGLWVKLVQSRKMLLYIYCTKLAIYNGCNSIHKEMIIKDIIVYIVLILKTGYRQEIPNS